MMTDPLTEPVKSEPAPDPQEQMRADSENLRGWAEGVTEQIIRETLAQAVGTQAALSRSLVAPNMRFDQQRQILINQAVMLKALSAILDRIHYGQTGKSCLRPVPGVVGGGDGKDKTVKS